MFENRDFHKLLYEGLKFRFEHIGDDRISPILDERNIRMTLGSGGPARGGYGHGAMIPLAIKESIQIELMVEVNP
jgi:hypothetical protein